MMCLSEAALATHGRVIGRDVIFSSVGTDSRAAVPDRLFVALRGPTPLSGDPHNAIGSTPGLGVIEVNRSGRKGELITIIPLTNPTQQPGQSPDPHGLRVRRRH